ncbi:MAG: acetyl-CoA carboxylase carboxyltransferase component [Colwellia sp.]|jgi:acetyl-CoA carboxylase carboxyltransferase component
MVSSIGGNGAVSTVFKQQRQQVINQQAEQQVKDHHQEVNRQAQEYFSAESRRSYLDARKGRYVNLSI